MSVPPRLESLRRAKVAAGALVVALLAGGIVYALRSSARPAPSGDAPDVRAPAAPAPPRADGSPEAGAPPPPAASRDRTTDPLLVRVVGRDGPEADVFVRVVEDDPAADAHRGCSTVARTDAQGLATVAVDRAAPAGAWLEVARGDATGLRHGFVALAPLRAAIAAREPATVTLPAGGSISLAFEGLPANARPRAVTFSIFPPFGEWKSLFPDAAVLPAGDGGLVECRAVPEAYRVRVGEDGVARLAHVPSDHAVAVRELDLPAAADAYVAAASTSTGPLVASPDGDVLRVLEGTAVDYVQRWRSRPSARVRVVGADGQPVAGARVGYGFRQAGAPPRFFDLSRVAEPDGVATVVLWTGPTLPSWTPEGLVFAASAPGRRATVVETPGRWYGVEVEARLGAPAVGRFAVEGTLAFADGRPAAGVPLRLASPEPFNVHGVIEPVRATADAAGRFSVEVPEDLRPLFEYAGGLRWIVDDERLEAMPSDALWRARWPSLPRARVVPDTFPLPPREGRARTDARLSMP